MIITKITRYAKQANERTQSRLSRMKNVHTRARTVMLAHLAPCRRNAAASHPLRIIKHVHHYDWSVAECLKQAHKRAVVNQPANQRARERMHTRTIMLAQPRTLPKQCSRIPFAVHHQTQSPSSLERGRMIGTGAQARSCEPAGQTVRARAPTHTPSRPRNLALCRGNAAAYHPLRIIKHIHHNEVWQDALHPLTCMPPEHEESRTLIASYRGTARGSSAPCAAAAACGLHLHQTWHNAIKVECQMVATAATLSKSLTIRSCA